MTSTPPTVDLWPDAIRRAVGGQGLRTVYQPIVDLQRATIIGYEALTRFDPIDGQRFGPDRWFDQAATHGLGPELDAAALAMALQKRAELPRNCFLSVNVDPDCLGHGCVLDVLAAAGSLNGLVIEITEHRPWRWEQLEPVVSRLRADGAMFAVDDAGSGYSGLQQILQLRPQILKLDRSLIENIDHDEAKVALVEMLGLFANRIDAWVLAEGVETAGEARRLLDLEVPLVQGYFFAKPGPAWVGLEPQVSTDLLPVVRAQRETLHRLVDPVAALAESNELAAAWACQDETWVPVVDDRFRPTGLIDGEAAFSGELLPALVVNVNSSPLEVANRVSTATADPAAPVIVSDNAGRYIGVISIRRLLSALTRQIAPAGQAMKAQVPTGW